MRFRRLYRASWITHVAFTQSRVHAVLVWREVLHGGKALRCCKGYLSHTGPRPTAPDRRNRINQLFKAFFRTCAASPNTSVTLAVRS